MEPMELKGRIVFVYECRDGLGLDCLLGERGHPGAPVHMVLRRLDDPRLQRVLCRQLTKWAEGDTPVEISTFDHPAGRRVRIGGDGTIVVLEPMEPASS